MAKLKPSKAPCGTCPYRRDVPPGLWAASEYEKLPLYDGSTSDQVTNRAFGVFMCHQNEGHLCAGWVGCHDMRHNLAVRLSPVDESVFDYVSPVPLFSSGTEAAVHGLLGDRDERTDIAITKLVRKIGEEEDQ